MASTEKLTRRIEELEGVVKKCYSQIEILSEKVHYLEKKQSIPNRRACLNHHAVKRHQRNAKYDFDSSSSDGSFYAKQSKSKGLICSKEVYKEVLQENHKALVEDLDLNNTFVLDQLIVDDVVSMSDKERIRSKSTTKDKTRELLLKLATYGDEKFHKFCSAIELDNPSLSHRLRSSFRKKINGYDSDEELACCLFCKLRDHVDPSDVIDDLYANKVVNAKTTKLILNEKNPDIAWKEIQYHINGCSDHFNVLCEALTKKYHHIKNELHQTGICNLKCTCKEIIQKQRNNQDVSSSNRTSRTSLDSTVEVSGSNEVLYNIEENRDTNKQVDPTGEKRKYVSLESRLTQNLSRYLNDVEHRNEDYHDILPFDKIKFYSLPPRLCLKDGFRNQNNNMGRVGEENSEADESEVLSNLDSISTNIEKVSIGVDEKIQACEENDENMPKSEEYTELKIPGGSQSRQVFHRRAFKRRKRELNNDNMRFN